MATTADQMESTYPLPSYRFVVSAGSDKIPFSDVSGLDIKYGQMEYKDGIGNSFKMPGQMDTVSITLKKGVFKGPNALYNWINSIQLNTVDKQDLVISLTDDSGTNLLVTWNVANAFPTSLTGTTLNASSNEIAIQEMTLVADRITIETY